MKPVIIQQLIQGMKKSVNKLPMPSKDPNRQRKDHTGLILALFGMAILLTVLLS